jgi:RNA polymerase sigma factor (sigma-70 family)
MSKASGNDDDAALVARCIRGDGAAWEVLVRRYQRLVYAIVLRMGLDEHMAADVFQTVFERLLGHLPGISEPNRLQAWIVTTAKREALLQRKRGQRTLSMTHNDSDDQEGPDWEFGDESPGAEEAIDELQQLHQVREAVDLLDARCRELLLLLFCDEDTKVTYEEIARRMSMTVGSIGPTRSRCLDKLRQLVSD